MRRFSLSGAVLAALLVHGACASRGGGGAEGPGAGGDVVLADVDTSALTAREKSDWSSYVSELLAPCPDQPVSIAECVQQNRPCAACRPAAKFLVHQVSKGKTRTQVDAAFNARFLPERVKNVEIGSAPSKGPPDAPVVIVEWADFECPFCGNAAPLLEELLARYKGSVRIAFKHYPLSIHKYAEPAARAAVAAGLQGKFWEMHALLFESAPKLDDPTLRRLAQKAGLDMKRFEADFASDAVRDVIEQDRRQADKLELRSTPMIFINGRRFELDQFKLTEDLDDWIALELDLKKGAPAAGTAKGAGR
jgi:protein-disulfide isomerase